MSKRDRAWSLDIEPVYDESDGYYDGFYFVHTGAVLKHIRVALKSGGTEVLTLHAVRPTAPYGKGTDSDVMTLRAIERDDKGLFINPLEQLMSDAELGRRVREAGLELK